MSERELLWEARRRGAIVASLGSTIMCALPIVQASATAAVSATAVPAAAATIATAATQTGGICRPGLASGHVSWRVDKDGTAQPNYTRACRFQTVAIINSYCWNALRSAAQRLHKPNSNSSTS